MQANVGHQSYPWSFAGPLPPSPEGVRVPLVITVALIVVLIVTAPVAVVVGTCCLVDGVEGNVEGGEYGDDDRDSWRQQLLYSRPGPQIT